MFRDGFVVLVVRPLVFYSVSGCFSYGMNDRRSSLTPFILELELIYELDVSCVGVTFNV